MKRFRLWPVFLLSGLFSSLTMAGLPKAGIIALPASPGLVVASDLVPSITEAGYEVSLLELDALRDPNTNQFSSYELIVAPGANRLPLEFVPKLDDYLKHGGGFMALGLPAWDAPLYRIQNRWITRSEYTATLRKQPIEKQIYSFTSEALTSWVRQCNTEKSVQIAEVTNSEGHHAMHVKVNEINGWDTMASPNLKESFQEGQLLTCFWAKGHSNTLQLTFEWAEKDASRWIAVVDLSTNWTYYALTPDAFKAWQPPASRSGEKDSFKPQNARRMAIGLALSHQSLPAGPHEYWIADIGSAKHPFAGESFLSQQSVPRYESLSPGYQVYPITQPVVLDVNPVFPGTLDSIKPIGVENALHPRPQGAGFGQDRPWRWQPILEASSQNDYRGAVGTLFINANGPYAGSVWAGFTPDRSDFYRQPSMSRLLAATAKKMRQGLYLIEGGAEYFTAFTNQPVRLGAHVFSTKQNDEFELHINLVPLAAEASKAAQNKTENQNKAADSIPSISLSWKDSLKSGGQKSFQDIHQFTNGWAQGYRVETELLQNGVAVDRLTHELHFALPGTNRSFIEIQDGEFRLSGKRWKAHGVNYMPSSGIGVGSDYFEHWIGKGAYDPIVIDRDLRRIHAMGLNAVSVFIYHRSLKAQHLLDFLRRCDNLEIKVNLSLRPGTPMDFRWQEMKELIEYYHMAENPVIFAYDLAWEPSHFDAKFQQGYRSAWNQFILKRHGSVAAAQAAWGKLATDSKSAPKADSDLKDLDVPTVSQLFHDGEWRRMVADYRCFLDQMLEEKYAEARRLVRTIDTRHPVSFRMQMAGDPTYRWEEMLPYDFFGLSKAVDIWEPEAYGRIGNWEQVKPGLFTQAYAKLCDPKKPLFWAEMGFSVWEMLHMQPASAKLEFAEQYYRDFYHMLIQSDADGIFFWWYPGGFRLNENSDYGIINPDGTDRSVTRAIREMGPLFMKVEKNSGQEVLIEVDRDADARGLNGIYEKTQKDFWKAIEEGKTPRLHWRKTPGSE